MESKDDEDKFMYKCNQLNMDAIVNAGNRYAGVAILAPRKYKLELNEQDENGRWIEGILGGYYNMKIACVYASAKPAERKIWI